MLPSILVHTEQFELTLYARGQIATIRSYVCAYKCTNILTVRSSDKGRVRCGKRCLLAGMPPPSFLIREEME